MLKTIYSTYAINKKQKDLLHSYVQVIKYYQKKLNLIGNSTIRRIWVRHIIDSMQILSCLPKEERGKILLDVGSGAGLPGVVLAIMGRKDVNLCEKSVKKSLFLKNVIKECEVNFKIYNCKIENLFKDNVSVIVSRAFAPIKKLLNSTNHILTNDTIFIIHKGKKHMLEIKEAKKDFFFTFKKYKSITSKEGCILKIENVLKKKYD